MKVTTPPSHSEYSKVKDGMIHGNFDSAVQESRLNEGKETKFRTGSKTDNSEYRGKMKY